MAYSFSYQLGSPEIPKALKYFILLTLSLSLFVGIFDPLFAYFFGYFPLEYLLGLSQIGISHFFIWQPFTYLLIHEVPYDGISIGFLISTAFNMYVLWMIGAEICERIGIKNFFYLYLLSGASAGLLSIFFAYSNYVLTGPWASLLAIFTLWSMLGPDREILLFFLIPFKVKWIYAGITGAILLVAFSHLNLVSIALYLVAVFSGYLYGTLKLQLASPFQIFEPVDRFFYRLSDKMSKIFSSEKKAVKPSKIYDLRTGLPTMDDEKFVDEMLAKIAKQGESALSWSEKKRLDEISAKKRQSYHS